MKTTGRPTPTKTTERRKYLLRQGEYLYFRYRGKLTAFSNADQTSAAFNREYDTLIRQAKLEAACRSQQQQQRPAASNATVAAAIAVFLDSAVFDRLSPTTQQGYRYTCAELNDKLGPARLCDVDESVVERLMDSLAKKHGRSVADRHMRMLNFIWKACRKFPAFGIRGLPNPTREVDKHYLKPAAPHRPWPVAVQEAFMANAKPHLQLAKLLLHFSLQRGCDAVRLTWADYDGVGLMVRQQKTHGERESLANYHHLPYPLRQALDAARPAVLSGTILRNEHGEPYANPGVLSHALKRELVRLGLAAHGEKTWTMHGLRKTGASEAATAGIGRDGIKSLGGWKTDSEAAYYARHGDTRRTNAAAVEAWDDELRRAADAPAAARRAAFKVVK
jgi:integrase